MVSDHFDMMRQFYIENSDKYILVENQAHKFPD
jgi:hypothetical protein